MAVLASQVKTVGVVGTGVIGASWIALFLAKGLRVVVADPARDAENQLKKHLNEMWPALEQLGLAENADIKNYIFAGPSISAHGKELDFVQENGPENIDLKVKILADIDQSLRPDVVIASSSSGIPSSAFIKDCSHPERVLIGHPFNPPHLMPLVEVVPHSKTANESLQQAIAFYEFCGKKPIHVTQEVPGFVANRLQLALCNEAYSLVSRGILSAKDVDLCVTNSLGIRWASVGPFMSNVLGGGKGGFKHLLEHIGPASHAWSDDMKKHAFTLNQENIERLNTSVQTMLESNTAEDAERERDADSLAMLNWRRTKGPSKE